ncbi:MAG: tRNA (adenosine(37)-N6)-threonylcarbamoyltransferase complex dimerization subunit type 1 TsaB [Saprospiraceae bacterium]
MSLLLHIESSKLSYSVALSRNSVCLSSEKSEDNNPTKGLNGLIASILEKNLVDVKDLNGIALNIGPGSYTSLRAGLSISKGLSVALNIPIIALPNELILVNAAKIKTGMERIICLIEARPNNYLISIFDTNYQTLESEIVFNSNSDTLSNCLKSSLPAIFIGENLDIIETQSIDFEYIKQEIKLEAQDLIMPATEQFQNQKFVNKNSLVPRYFNEPKITISKKTLT